MGMFIISHEQSNLIDPKICGRKQFFCFFNPNVSQLITKSITGFLLEQRAEIIAV